MIRPEWDGDMGSARWACAVEDEEEACPSFVKATAAH